MRKTLIDRILFEALDTEHALTRFKERINQSSFVVGYEASPQNYIAVGTFEIPENIKTIVSQTVDLILNYNFPKKKSYGIKVLEINIDKNKIAYYNPSLKEDAKMQKLILLAKESNGNVVYVIIRENNYRTIYYAKSYVAQTKEKLDVDVIISNLPLSIEKKTVY